MRITKEYISYTCIRAFLSLFSWMPYRWIRKIGRFFGPIGFYLLKDFRKSALSNLALAKDLHLSNKECYSIAKKAFVNLAITCLEFPKLIKDQELENTIICENPEVADSIVKEGKGIIFFCGHQSNWEVLFFDGTRRMKGAALGKGMKNSYLTQWIQKGRERFGGEIIPPKEALKKGLTTLRKGHFLGIVGDQGMPDSGYSYPFLGRKMWFSPLPALFAIRSGSPIIVATTKRTKNGYRIHYSDPLWPNKKAPLKTEMKRLMDMAVSELESSIAKSPEEWFWQHNCWKQQTPEVVYRRFRKDAILIIFPEERKKAEELCSHLFTFKQIYPEEFLFLMVPESLSKRSIPIEVEEIFSYRTKDDIQRNDLRFKLVYNFSSYQLEKHFLSLSSFEVIDYNTLYKLSEPLQLENPSLSDILLSSLTRNHPIGREKNAS